MIKLTYEARHGVQLDDALDFQGDAKTITQENLDKLKARLHLNGGANG